MLNPNLLASDTPPCGIQGYMGHIYHTRGTGGFNASGRNKYGYESYEIVEVKLSKWGAPPSTIGIPIRAFKSSGFSAL